MNNHYIEQIRNAHQGDYLPHSISDKFHSLNGSDVRQWLESEGYTVIKNFDTGMNGLAITACGMRVSTNGYCSEVVL